MDRFIRSSCLSQYFFNRNTDNPDEERVKDLLDQQIEKTSNFIYRQLLSHALGFKNEEGKIFQFKTKNVSVYNNLSSHLNPMKTHDDGFCKKDWLVKPRIKPFLATTNPLMVLDLPRFTAGPYMIPIGWSSRGLIAAAIQGSIFLWDSEKRDIHANQITNYSNQETRTLKWSKNGLMLAIIPKHSSKLLVFLIENKLNPKYIIHCPCENCQLFSLEWHPDDYLIASGCSKGILRVWKFNEKKNIISVSAHNKPISLIRSNYNGKYLMSASPDLTVTIWHWNLTKVFTITLFQEVCCACWHPQNHTLLAIGGGSATEVGFSLWDISGGRQIGQYATRHLITVWSLEWSLLTGELVVGIWKRDNEHSYGTGYVLILSSMDTVVDRVEATACYLMWSPDNTLIGMAGSDKLLRIWQFISPRRKKSIIDKKWTIPRRSKLTLYNRL